MQERKTWIEQKSRKQTSRKGILRTTHWRPIVSVVIPLEVLEEGLVQEALAVEREAGHTEEKEHRSGGTAIGTS